MGTMVDFNVDISRRCEIILQMSFLNRSEQVQPAVEQKIIDFAIEEFNVSERDVFPVRDASGMKQVPLTIFIGYRETTNFEHLGKQVQNFESRVRQLDSYEGNTFLIRSGDVEELAVGRQ